MSAGGDEGQSDHHQKELRQYSHLHAIARIHHGGETQTHLHGNELTGDHEGLEKHHGGKAETDTDEQLQHRIGEHAEREREYRHRGQQ